MFPELRKVGAHLWVVPPRSVCQNVFHFSIQKVRNVEWDNLATQSTI